MTMDEMRAQLQRMRDEAKNAAEIHSASIRDSNTPGLNEWYKAQAEGKDKDREALDWALLLLLEVPVPRLTDSQKQGIQERVSIAQRLAEPGDDSTVEWYALDVGTLLAAYEELERENERLQRESATNVASAVRHKEDTPMADEIRDPMDQDDDEVIILTDEAGQEHEFTIVQVMKVDEKDYAILLPVEAGEEESEEAVIFRIDQEEGEDVLVEIEDGDEFERVAEAWEELLDDEDDEVQ